MTVSIRVMTAGQGVRYLLNSVVVGDGGRGGGTEGADSGRAIREVLDRVGDKWSLLVIATLRRERLRFSALQRHIPGVSQRMLTLTLPQLERDGLITRTVHPEVPPRVEHELTDLGATLIQYAMALAEWAIENRPRIEESRTAYDQRLSAPGRS